MWCRTATGVHTKLGKSVQTILLCMTVKPPLKCCSLGVTAIPTGLPVARPECFHAKNGKTSYRYEAFVKNL